MTSRRRADPSGATWIRCLDENCRCQSDPTCRDPILRPGGGTARPEHTQIEWRGRVRQDGVC